MPVKQKKGQKKTNPQQKNKSNKPGPTTQAPKEQSEPKKPKTSSTEPFAKFDEYLDKEYQQYTEKQKHMKTFFGIFTKHNLQQFRLLLKYSGINLSNEMENSHFQENLYKVEMRDVNQFIFHGDIEIGAVVCEQVGSDALQIRALCILPNFRGYGFGSRLMANLIKAALHRHKIQKLLISVNKSDNKINSFLNRFGFQLSQETDNNPDGNEQKTDVVDSNNSNTKTMVLSLGSLRKRIRDAIKHDEENPVEVKSNVPKNSGGKKSSE